MLSSVLHSTRPGRGKPQLTVQCQRLLLFRGLSQLSVDLINAIILGCPARKPTITQAALGYRDYRSPEASAHHGGRYSS